MTGTQKLIRCCLLPAIAGLIPGMALSARGQAGVEAAEVTSKALLATPVEALSPAEPTAPAPGEAARVLPAEPVAKPRSGTTITANKDATFDNQERKASFSGNVKVSDPEFDLTCDSLTVFLSGSKEAGDKPAGDTTSALHKAVADGNVVVVQHRTADDGSEKIYHGKAEHGIYDATTGEFALTGWAEVRQGINSHIGTEKSTKITITKDGKMKTEGASRTVIEETPDES